MARTPEKGALDLERTAAAAIEGAGRRGVADVKAAVARSRSVSVTYRLGRPDKVEESVRRALSLYLYDRGRYTVCETNDLREEALERFLDSAVALVRATTPDPFREITDPALYAGRLALDLGTHDPSIAALTPAERHDLAARAEAAVLAEAGAGAVAAEAGFEDEESELFQAHSNGFAAGRKGTRFGIYAEVSLADAGDRRPSDSEFASTRKHAALPSPEEIGRGAARRARGKLGAAPMETATLPVIVENRAVGRLLGKLLAALGGRALQQEQSFLAGALGSAVGSPILDVVDDPFVVGGAASRLFDGEGITARPMQLFARGVLESTYLDTYYAKKLGQGPTTGAWSNVVVTPGARSVMQLMGDVGRGLLVRGFVGGNSNPTTGDFSLGVHGTLIENGAPGRAVAEMNISGNHKELWKRLAAAGNDTWPYGSIRSPSLLFDAVQLSGSGGV
jgi:PmbA protein